MILPAEDLGCGDPRLLNPESWIPTPHVESPAREGRTAAKAHSPRGRHRFKKARSAFHEEWKPGGGGRPFLYSAYLLESLPFRLSSIHPCRENPPSIRPQREPRGRIPRHWFREKGRFP